MIDVVGAIVLSVVAVGTPGVLILLSRLDRRQTTRMIVGAVAWLATVSALAAAGAFVTLGAPAIGVAVVAPLVILAVGTRYVRSLRALALGAPLALLVALHVSRLLGAFFLFLHADGRLPTTFARAAGWGDIAVAAVALPVAWMVARQASFWRPVALVWNAAGFVDLVGAVTIGIGSAPDFPLRFIVEDSIPGTMAVLPWALIPTFLVPLYLLMHLTLFTRLAAGEHAPNASRLAATVGPR
jgi:hypothetical protein